MVFSDGCTTVRLQVIFRWSMADWWTGAEARSSFGGGGRVFRHGAFDGRRFNSRMVSDRPIWWRQNGVKEQHGVLADD